VIAQRLAAGGRPELLARHSICQISRAVGFAWPPRCSSAGQGAWWMGLVPPSLARARTQMAWHARSGRNWPPPPVWSRSPRAGAKLTSRLASSPERGLIGPRRQPVSLVLGCSTTRLVLLGGTPLGPSSLVVRVVVGAAGHQGKAGPPDLVAGRGQGDLGVGPVVQAGLVAVVEAAGLAADAGGQVKDRPPPPRRASRLMP
jgi:hypothetical protein